MGQTATLPADTIAASAHAGLAGVPLEELRAQLQEPARVAVRGERGQVWVWERGSLVLYELGPRRRQGFGWVAHVARSGCEPIECAVKASEVMALAREAAKDRDVAEITLATAEAIRSRPGAAEPAAPDAAASYDSCFTDPRWDAYRRKSVARRLREEVEEGRNFGLVSTRPIRKAIVDRLIAGERLADLCRRGGFMGGGKPDISWLERRAGLRADSYANNGQRQFRRVVPYELYVRLVRAVDGDPIDFEPAATTATSNAASEPTPIRPAAAAGHRRRERLGCYTDPAGAEHWIELVSGQAGGLVIDLAERRAPRVVAELDPSEGRAQAEATLLGTPAGSGDAERKGPIVGYIERARESRRPLCRALERADIEALDVAFEVAA